MGTYLFFISLRNVLGNWDNVFSNVEKVVGLHLSEGHKISILDITVV